MVEPTPNQNKLIQLKKSGKLEPYISHIRFPNYKNLTFNLLIEFNYPISAIVGPNGTNKSSILRAMYGTPGFNNLGNLWFSTSIDPIEETGAGPSCFIYGYLNKTEGKVVEVIKTRIRKEDDPDYWEPSRPILKYGMEKMPEIPKGSPPPEGRSKTRWNSIEKNVIYIDFRGALSAFDKFFYHSDMRSKLNTPKNKKDFIRTRSPHLKKAIELGCQSLIYRKRERVLNNENRALSDEETKEISFILGRSYTKIHLIRHEFFNTDAYTCLMATGNLKYSEAFAGSGEFSVVRIVVEVMNAPTHSLVLLDEPEVSLHPGAQERMLEFLEKKVLSSKLQIVISTHSPAIVRKLPAPAIKVLMTDPASGKIILSKQASRPEEAFFHLGEPISGKTTILVEDILAVNIIGKSLRPHGQAANEIFSIKSFSGGAPVLWKHAQTFAASNRDDVFILFDGDQRGIASFVSSKDIPASKNSELQQMIVDVIGVKLDFYPDAGAEGPNYEQLYQMQRQFIDWAISHVSYLPGTGNPEEFIWTKMPSDELSNDIVDDDFKKRFEKLTRKELQIADFETIKSEDILATQKRRLALISDDDDDLKKLGHFLMSLNKG